MLAFATETGGAWLSSARVVTCWVKSRNERTPYCRLLAGKLRTPARLPSTRWRKAGTTSSHHGPYVLGDTRATMAGTERCEPGRVSRPQKACPSTDWGLQPGPTKLESLVISDHNAAVNTFPGLVHTARHTMGVDNTRSQWPNRKEGAA